MKKTLFAASLIFGFGTAVAAPAPWFLWRSALGDHDICAQFSPGDGWVAVKGPFADSGCRKPASQG